MVVRSGATVIPSLNIILDPNVVKLVPYAMLNQFNTNNLLIAALLMPFGWVGVRLGLVIQRKLNDKVFYRIILVLLLAIGIKLIADAVSY